MQIQLSTWKNGRSQALPIRLEVFVKEQSIPLEMEEDRFDSLAIHAILTLQDQVIGTARLFQEDFQSSEFMIGRLCVLKNFRQQGYGRALMNCLLDQAQKLGAKSCMIHAQSKAKNFYASMDFSVCSPPFMEAGIEHVLMRRIFNSDAIKNLP